MFFRFFNDVTLIYTHMDDIGRYVKNDVTAAQSGYYTCRASNGESAVTSEPALVIIKGE